MRPPALRPLALQPGDRVAVVAPGSPVDPVRVRAGVDQLASWGFEPVVFPHVLDRTGFLAGSDDDRLADLTGAWADPTVRGIVCARGGYGCQRIVDRLDYAAVRRDPKVFVGFSDVTALHLALGGRAGIVTFHGPMAAWDVTRTGARSAESLRRAISDPAPLVIRPDPQAAVETLVAGAAVGPLVGGNLSLLSASVGTADQPDLDGCLLLLEEVAEAPYRVDRMLRHLVRAGLLDGVVGVIVAECVGCDPSPADPTAADPGSDGPGAALRDVLAELFAGRGLPAVMGLPLGHGPEQLTVPLGVPARLDADDGTIEFLEPALAWPQARRRR
jgi:muramoyltetrapeptide carboxypeptidase